MTSGSGYSNLQQLLAPAGISFMCPTSYMKHQKEIIRDILATSAENLKINNQEEKRRAMGNGYYIFVADVKGTIFIVVWITVICDASWLQRTYPGGAYDSLAGTAVVIGAETKKPLAFVVKCKACASCDRGGDVVKDHHCYKNFDRSRGSESMESEGIVELFQESWDKHGIVYKYIVADGDSSVICGILNADPYSQFGITVRKFTCLNHKLKNHGKAIDNIAAKFKGNKEVREARKLVGGSKLKFRQEILEASKRRREDKTLSYEDKLILLHQDIMILSYHVFGDHEKCQKNGG